jgi:MFS family permease
VSSHSYREEAGASGRLYRWYVVGILGLIYFVAFVDRLALSLLVEPIKRELRVNDTQIGALFGLSFAGALALLSLPLGRLADRGNRRNLIAGAVAVWSLMTAASGLARSYAALLVCRVGLAAGEAGLTPAALSVISDLFPTRSRALPVAVYLTAGIAGATGSLVILALLLHATEGMGQLALPLVGQLSPWRLTLVLIGLPTTFLALLLLLTVREPDRDAAASAREPVWAALTYLRLHFRDQAGFYLAGALMALLSISATAWYPTFLIRDRGLSASSVGYLFGFASIFGGISGSLALPAAAQALALRRDDGLKLAFLAGVVVGVPCFVLAATVGSLMAEILLIACANFCFIGGINIPALAIQQSAPPRLRAQLSALYFVGVNVGGLGTGPLLTAEVARLAFGGEHGLGAALASLGAVAGPVALLALLSLPRAAAGSLPDLAPPGRPIQRRGTG